MKRRHVLVGVTSVASLGAFLAVWRGDGSPGIGLSGPTDDETNRGEELAGRPLDEIEAVEIPVAIDHEPGARTEPVRDALAYWEANAETYAGFDVEYRLVETDPYLTVSLQPSVTSCDTELNEIHGCADVPDDRLPDDLEARIGTTLTDTGIYEAAVHELGHTLGLRHGDDPAYYMAATLPNPWEREEVGVRFGDGVRDTDDILAGLDWVRRNVEAVRARFYRADRGEREPGVVVSRQQDACEGEFVSCAEWGDRYDDRIQINLDSSLDPSVLDWHTARIIASYPGAVPAVLRTDASYDLRSSDWWETR